jgi:hypothetical protein
MSRAPVSSFVSRRRFVTGVAAAAATLAVPRFAFGQASGCDRLAETTKGWDAVRPMLASRYHRLQHVFFHYIRNNWDTLTAKQQKALADLGWAAPRPSLFAPQWSKRPSPSDNTVVWATANGSGIDFLYFHRWMIAMVDAMLKAAGKPTIASWSDKDTIPGPLRCCPDETVPEFTPWFENPAGGAPIGVPWLQLRVQEMKSPSFYWNRMNWWGQDYRDFGMLRRITLGELGSRLEFSVHNQMHIRWSAYPANGHFIRNEDDFRTKWDDPGYDTLFDEYSSHVTPIFFRLHKWIDNRIEDWAEAQGTRLQRYDTGHGFEWYRSPDWVEINDPWSGAWGWTTPIRRSRPGGWRSWRRSAPSFSRPLRRRR